MAECIPFGQPILVGHHSEGRDRNYRNKIRNTFEKAHDEYEKSQYYEDKAASVGKGGISSDDEDAISKLQAKLEKLETLQERMKQTNKLLKKNDIDGLRTLGYTDSQIAELKKPSHCCQYGYASYTITNNGATIRATKKRMEELQAKAERQPVSVKHEGFTYQEEDNRCQFIFDGKPSDEIRSLLKSYAFKFSPTRSAWVRMLNGNGRYAAKSVIEKLKSLTI
jgi:hypothetical protein